MRHVFFNVLICCVFCSFVQIEAQMTPQELREIENGDRIADRIIKIFSQKMYKDKGLVTIGTGGGAAEGSSKGLTMLSISMESYQKTNVQQARQLLLECVGEYIAEINKHEEFKKYAYSFPFNFRNVSISILFVDRITQEFYSPPCLAAAHVDRGEFSYGISPDPMGPLQTVGNETYEEACTLIK